MKLSKLFLLIVLILISYSTTHGSEVEPNNKDNDERFDHLPSTDSDNSPLRGLLFNFQSLQKARLTCNMYPRVCRAKGSLGPDCCKKKCVNVETDRNNCGMCGNKCKYSRICCNGRCVNPMFNRMHCGGCGNGCSKGSSCAYGMCDYA